MSLTGKNPGRLDRRISLRYPTITRDAIGGVREGFTLVTGIPAFFEPAKGREYFGTETKQSDGLVVFLIRYRADIDTTWQVLHNGVYYELVGHPVESGRQQWLELICNRLADQNGASVANTIQAFSVSLSVDDEAKAVVFPVAFPSVPRSVTVSLVIPTNGYIFNVAVLDGSITRTGLTVDLSAVTPDVGYSLYIQAIL